MIVGYVVARIVEGKAAGIYDGLIAHTPEDAEALRVAARIAYPGTYSTTVVIALEVA